MNLQKISEAKDKMESMYNSIYDLQEAVLEDNEQKIEISTVFKSKARELYLSLITASVIKEDELDIHLNNTSIVLLETLIEECSGLSVIELQKKTRFRDYALARQVHMTFLNVTYGLSTTRSGNYYNKDHATVLHAKKTIRDLYQVNPEFRERYMKVIDHCIRFDLSRNSTKTQDFLNEK